VKKLLVFLSLILISRFTQAKNDTIKIKKTLNEVNINAIRAQKETPIAFTNINKTKIEEINLGIDIPLIISTTPSIVSSSDAGNGIGYTGFRLRGSDPTRINITVNGIPLNDSESQGVWWVNMPDFLSSIEDIQIQRGVGTSTNGAAAFGGSINLNTNDDKIKPFTSTNNTIGSYNTFKNNIQFGTGLINKKLSFEGRLSRIASDGYIDRASSDLKSLYLQGSYFGMKYRVNAVVFAGQEYTYQAWNGVPINYLDTNRTFNSYSYKNEIDNYNQTHYQLHYNRTINDKTKYNIAFHYTHGEGYYEQKKEDELFTDYNLENIIVSYDTIRSTDLIRRKWLNNDFGGITFSLHHDTKNINVIFGGASNRYSGQHYGNIIWAEYAINIPYNYEYYKNIATKYDNNLYIKANYSVNNKTNLYADLQRRNIDYHFTLDNAEKTPQTVNHDFFNPKIGIYYTIDASQSIYASYAVANREPNRNDYRESSIESRPKHETLNDFELGYKINKGIINFNLNIYNMIYQDQLVLTGKINDVGAYTRTNIPESFRKGVEIQGGVLFNRYLQWTGNLTLSQNKIVNYTAYVDNWDTWGQEAFEYTNTDLAFSPSIIWSSNINIKLKPNLKFDFISKYVGEQFIDNTSSESRKLDDYLVNNIRLIYKWENTLFKDTRVSFQINNILNNEYVSNAWVYRFISDNFDPRENDPYVNKSDDRGYNMAGYFPQATRNYLLGLSLGF